MHQIQPEYGDEQADAGRHCRTRLARQNSQARTNADREIFVFFPVQLTTCRIGNLTTRLIHTLAICVTIHTYPCRDDLFYLRDARSRCLLPVTLSYRWREHQIHQTCWIIIRNPNFLLVALKCNFAPRLNAQFVSEDILTFRILVPAVSVQPNVNFRKNDFFVPVFPLKNCVAAAALRAIYHGAYNSRIKRKNKQAG